VELIVHLQKTLTDSGSAEANKVSKTMTVWEESKVASFQKELYLQNNAIAKAKQLLSVNIDDALKCLTDALLKAGKCMEKTVHQRSVPKQRRTWFDNECRANKRLCNRLWNQLKRRPNPHKRQLFTNQRKTYFSLRRQKRRDFEKTKACQLADNIGNSKLFWKDVNALGGFEKAHLPNNIKSEEWVEHFRDVLQGSAGVGAAGESAVLPNVQNDSLDLDNPITKAEILLQVEHAKSNKSAGADKIINEMLKASQPLILDFLVDLFNKVFFSGVFPEEWSKAIIVPIYKKGNPGLPDNYRGISIVSVICKIYTSVLNTRLYNWLEENNKISECQAGFRRGYSTIDNIFVLYSVVQRYLTRSGKRLYVAFIDLKKAFDSVQHNVLLASIQREGITGIFFNAIKSMYSSLKACVRTNDVMSEYFECPVGVRQGCVLSPTLFTLLINQLAVDINTHGIHGVQISVLIELFVLLFADDIALLSDTPGGLQVQLNLLNVCCKKLKLTVNNDKSKIVVFRNGGILSKYEKWSCDNVSLEVVNQFCYLGYTFSTKLSPRVGTNSLLSKAKTASFFICRAFQKCNEMTKNVFFKLFESKVQSILLYSSEIWGLHRIEGLETVHMQACKRFLGVSIMTPNKMVYSELQRFPLYVCSALRVIKYWIRILCMDDNRLPKQCYNMLLCMDRNGYSCWVTKVRLFLCQSGFSYVWLSQDAQTVKCVLPYLKQRLIDNFVQEWEACMRNSERYCIYRTLKDDFFCANRIFHLDTYCYRKAFCQLRMDVLPINAHLYRYSSILGATLCPWCPQCVEDGSHFLKDCTLYSDLRRKICPYVSTTPLGILLNGKNERTLKDMAKFTFLALKIRQRCIVL
jgi:hypothetical protein